MSHKHSQHSKRHQTPASGGYQAFADPEPLADYEYENTTQEPQDYFSYGTEEYPTADMAPKASRNHRQRQSSTEDDSQDEEFIWSPETGNEGTNRKRRDKLPMSERVMKRRDQNRISQRAFRQRKEKHVKDLQAKVDELENLLEASSHENSIFFCQLGRLEEELRYYRQLLFAGATGQNLGASPTSDHSGAASFLANQQFSSSWDTANSALQSSRIPSSVLGRYTYPRSSCSTSDSLSNTPVRSNSPSPDSLPGSFTGTPLVKSEGMDAGFSKTDADGFWEAESVENWSGTNLVHSPGLLPIIPVDMMHNRRGWATQQSSQAW